MIHGLKEATLLEAMDEEGRKLFTFASHLHFHHLIRSLYLTFFLFLAGMEEQYRQILILLERAGQIEIIGGEGKKEEKQFINVTLNSDWNEIKVKEEITTAVPEQ